MLLRILLYVCPALAGTGKELGMGFAHTEQGSALHLVSFKRDACANSPRVWGREAPVGHGTKPHPYISPRPRVNGEGGPGRKGQVLHLPLTHCA